MTASCLACAPKNQERVITEWIAGRRETSSRRHAFRDELTRALESDRLEYLYGMFGEDRVIFGTDYPNSYGVATMSEEVGLMKKFFSTKTRPQAEKYFWRNAARIYKYVTRGANQPRLA